MILLLVIGRIGRVVGIKRGSSLASSRAVQIVGDSYETLVLADNPDVFLKLEELSGAVAVDSSGNGNNFTRTNMFTALSGSKVVALFDPNGYTTGRTGPFYTGDGVLATSASLVKNLTTSNGTSFGFVDGTQVTFKFGNLSTGVFGTSTLAEMLTNFDVGRGLAVSSGYITWSNSVEGTYQQITVANAYANSSGGSAAFDALYNNGTSSQVLTQGTNGYLEPATAGIGDAVGVDAALTIEMWIKPISYSIGTDDTPNIVTKFGNDDGYQLCGSYLDWNAYGTEGEFDAYTPGPDLTANNWHHVVAIYEAGGYPQLWLNGVAMAVDEEEWNILPSMAAIEAKLSVGASIWEGDVSGQPFNGQMSRFALYPTVLSPASIAAHYAEGAPA